MDRYELHCRNHQPRMDKNANALVFHMIEINQCRSPILTIPDSTTRADYTTGNCKVQKKNVEFT
jgi:hypothetical protein